MSLPFFRGPVAVDGMAGALALAHLYQLDAQGMAEAIGNVDTVEVVTTVTGPPDVPLFGLVQTERFLIVCVCGVQNTTQAILVVVQSNQVQIPPIPGFVGEYWGNLSGVIYSETHAWIADHLGDRSIVLIGHSLGGAVVECLAARVQHDFTAPLSVFTYGAPRSGNPEFAAALTPVVTRWENTSDPICGIPPVSWQPIGSAWPTSGPPPDLTYAAPGNASTVDQFGNISPGSDPPSTALAAWFLATGQMTAHQPFEYARRISLSVTPEQLTPEFNGYAAPQFLFPDLETLLGVSPVATATTLSPSVATLYLVHVEYEYGDRGISEDFWTTQLPTDIRAYKGSVLSQYLTKRLAMAVDSMKFLYARISNVATPRIVDFVTNTDPGFGLKGAIKAVDLVPDSPGPAGGPIGAADDDALLLRLKIVGGPSGRIFLHAYDGNMDNQGTFEPNKTFNNAFNNFMTFITGNPLFQAQFFPQPGLTARKPIQTIVAQTPRGALITPTNADLVIASANKITIGGIGRQMQGIAGRKIVQTVAAGGASFVVGGAAPVGSYTAPGGYYYILTPSFGQISYGAIERITEHKVGTPFGEYRGRKPNRLPLRL